MKAGDFVKCVNPDSRVMLELDKVYEVEDLVFGGFIRVQGLPGYDWMESRFELLEPKFKVGDKVRVVKGGWGISVKDLDKTTTVLSLNGYGEFGFYYGVDDSDFEFSLQQDHTKHNVYECSLELEAARPNEALVNGMAKLRAAATEAVEAADLLEIEYCGITLKFDPAVKKSKKLVDAVIEAIYNGLTD